MRLRKPRQLRRLPTDGVTLSAINLVDGERRTWCAHGVGHEDHSARAALKSLTDELYKRNDRGACWRVLAISTPSTIYRDLQGSRVAETTRGERPRDLPEVPETRLLGDVDAIDLLLTTPREPRRRSGSRRSRLRRIDRKEVL